MRKKTIRSRAWSEILTVALFFLLILSLMILGLHNTSESIQAHGKQAAEEAIRRAAVSCYAMEGSYPESYEYLKQHYGIAINEDLYVIEYHVFASNIMPDITVIKR